MTWMHSCLKSSQEGHSSQRIILFSISLENLLRKLSLREACELTNDWDDSVPADLRSKWVDNIWRLEQLRGIKFKRARMPADAISTDMSVIIAVDASGVIKCAAAWARFKLKNGKYSCQLLFGRVLLASDKIPRNELEALLMGSNLGWILMLILSDWIVEYIVIGDSTIALCWTVSDKKRLSLFHRNRCAQIRRGTDLDKLYHVKTEFNPADVPTRPNLVKDEDVGPNSVWEKGLPWMNNEVQDAINEGILTPAKKL